MKNIFSFKRLSCNLRKIETIQYRSTKTILYQFETTSFILPKSQAILSPEMSNIKPSHEFKKKIRKLTPNNFSVTYTVLCLTST